MTTQRLSILARLRRIVALLRTEGSGPSREIAAVASGVFIGCLPVYGFHLLICGAVGSILKLNRLKMYVAANISNPVVAPVLVFLEIQAGAWLRRGSFHPLTIETVKATNPATFGADLLYGSVAVGAVLAALAAGLMFAFVGRASRGDDYASLAQVTSDRYIDAGIVAWEFARAKLKRDPVYRACACGGLLAHPFPEAPDDRANSGGSAGTLLDVGCGQGLTLALLAEAREAHDSGRWPPNWPPPPLFHALIGIDIRPRVVAIASAALGGDAQVIVGDARAVMSVRPQVILLFDVLHMVRREEQEAVLATLAAALAPRGVMLIREADAAAGWRFECVRWGNWLKAAAYGSWNQPFHFRTAAEWQACFAGLGLHTEVREMSEGTPFANVLFRVTRLQS